MDPTAPIRWSDTDHAALAARGIPPAEAERQLRQLAAPPRYADLVRPCTPGDGIESRDGARSGALVDRATRAAAAGRLSRFVPASGAASRMFKELLGWRTRGGSTSRAVLEAAAVRDSEAREVRTFVDGLPRFAFRDALAAALASAGLDLERLAAAGPIEPVLDALLASPGLAYADRPKGLLAFHRACDGPRSAFEEQLEEAAAAGRASDGRCRAHFTVSPEHRAGFKALLATAGPHVDARHATQLEVGFSVQSPSTDTLALDAHGRPFRGERDELLFRPAGHGALIGNLGALDADVVQVKNVDNVQPDGRREATVHAWALLTGLALETEERLRAVLARLADAGDGAACDAAAAFARETFGLAPEVRGAARAAWRAWLDRPVRVAGMVPNQGEPGGGPFWVRGRDGVVWRQVVERAEVDPHAPAQQAILARATHFNPVFMVCLLHDVRGGHHDLARYVDDDAAIITHKSSGGRALVALERPGLWNGAMGGWLTRFVDVPLEVFTPVKTVNDLLRPEHQPA